MRGNSDSHKKHVYRDTDYEGRKRVEKRMETRRNRTEVDCFRPKSWYRQTMRGEGDKKIEKRTEKKTSKKTKHKSKVLSSSVSSFARVKRKIGSINRGFQSFSCFSLKVLCVSCTFFFPSSISLSRFDSQASHPKHLGNNIWRRILMMMMFPFMTWTRDHLLSFKRMRHEWLRRDQTPHHLYFEAKKLGGNSLDIFLFFSFYRSILHKETEGMTRESSGLRKYNKDTRGFTDKVLLRIMISRHH